MPENISITNSTDKEYSPEDLSKSANFLLFFYQFRPATNTSPVNVDISNSQICPGNNECELSQNQRKLSFLLSPTDFHQDLVYFREKYLPGIPKFPLYQEDYSVQEISLLDYAREIYEIRVKKQKKQQFQNPQDFWNNLIELSIPDCRSLDVWTKINSFYMQLKNQLKDPVERDSPIFVYLMAIQRRISDIGAGHLDYVGSVITNKRYPVPEDKFQVRDPKINPERIKAYSFTPDLETSVFFEPEVNMKMFESGSDIIRTSTGSLLSVVYE